MIGLKYVENAMQNTKPYLIVNTYFVLIPKLPLTLDIHFQDPEEDSLLGKNCGNRKKCL